MRKIYTLMAFLLSFAAASAQSVTLTFTGQDINSRYVRLDSIVVRNLNYGWQETLQWPDTVLTLSVTGLEDFEDQDFAYLHLSQNIPNPFETTTYVNLDVAQVGDVSVEIRDVIGRLVKVQRFAAVPGHYQFRVNLSSAGVYFLTARMNGQTTTVKMVNRGNGGTDDMELTDNETTWHVVFPQSKVAHRGVKVLPFDIGDEMEYVGYATFNNNGVAVESRTVSQSLDTEVIPLTFDRSVTDGLPCQGDPTLTDIDGNVYNTVMIGTQCWMKENLRTTHFADETSIPTSIAGSGYAPCRYAPANDSDNVKTYGYLYNWHAVMHGATASYANPSGVQGVCPERWHVPSDSEWTKLTEYVSHVSSYLCDSSNSETIAKTLASRKGWEENFSLCAVGNDTASNNISGFSALPAGNYIGSYNLFGYYAYFWSTSQGSSGYSYTREMAYHKATVQRDDNLRSFGFSVRCVRDEFFKPTVTTDSVRDITAQTATCGGEVTDEGGVSVTARGVCWSTSPNPTVSDNHTTDGTGLGSFTSNITNLMPGTTYYVRAYATNNAGTAYGNAVMHFTTMALPVVRTDSTVYVANDTAICGGEVIDDGGSSVIARGVCWSITPNPVVTGGHTTDGAGLGEFSSTLSGLDPNTTYYVKAYATNSVGTGYGAVVSFTSPVVKPTVTTDTVINITKNSAKCCGTVVSDGGANVTGRGVCWDTLPNPTFAVHHISSGSGTGQFTTSNITNLTPGTTYYVRAYAINSVDTAYGNELQFTTLAELPTVTTFNVSDADISDTSAFCQGQVTDNGGATITEQGFCWNTTSNPDTSSNHIAVPIGTGVFSYSITGLTPGSTYHVRAYATNSAGTAYGEDKSFNTKALPTVTTNVVSDITDTSATCGGNVTDAGGDYVSARGVCWSTSSNPTIEDSHTSDGVMTGVFTSALTNLLPSTTYYVRAYATNSVGTAYGEAVEFTTLGGLSSVVTGEVGDCSSFSASCVSEVTDEGGAPITACGVCWSASEHPTIADYHTTDGDDIGTFVSEMTNLEPNHTYYVRAYATNSVGTAYGNEVEFHTAMLPLGTSIVTISEITTSTAICNGSAYFDNECMSTCDANFGVYVDISPEMENGEYIYGEYSPSNIDMFTVNLTELLPGTTYYVQAFASNCAGEIFGEVTNFTTDSENPSITTTLGTVYGTSAVCGGIVTSDGGSMVTARGVCWSTSTNPTLETVGDFFTTEGEGLGEFTSTLMGLTPGVTYNVRAYATNSEGTSYGEEMSFTTLNMLTVTTNNVNEITARAARCGGEVFYDGGSTVTARGVCWNTSHNPTVSDMFTVDGDGEGVFTSNLTNLTPNTTYYVRAYATNSENTSYGEEVTFTTPATLPAVTTVDAVSNISAYTATCGGEVSDDGGMEVIARGICWIAVSATVESDSLLLPTINDGVTFDNIGLGSFTSNLVNLDPGTTYYVRAYATNSVGTAYGDVVVFTTLAVAPSVSTFVVKVYGTSATCGGNVTKDGGASVTERGICWNSYANPSMNDNFLSVGTGTGFFTCDLTNLTPGEMYYLRAYAINNVDTAYGDVMSITTLDQLTVKTDYISEVCRNTATCWGSVIYDGGYDVIERGFCWGVFQEPTLEDSHIANSNNGQTSFMCSLSDLNTNTTYYVRAYAINASDTAYGEEESFMTLEVDVPSVIISSVSNITDSSATCGGYISNIWCESIVEKGICWSTMPNPDTSFNHCTSNNVSSSFTCDITGLLPGGVYYVRAYAINDIGIGYSEQRVFSTNHPCPGDPTITDIDGNVYNTVLIGDQCWMRENLRVTHFADNTEITLGDTHSLTQPHRYAPANSIANVFAYGYLYNWAAVMHGEESSVANPSGVQGICPGGWHVPGDSEWTQLIDYVSSHDAYYCGEDNSSIAKALASSSLWNACGEACSVGDEAVSNNLTDFSALPAGLYDQSGQYLGERTYLWSSTSSSDSNVWLRKLQFDQTVVSRIEDTKSGGFSVRCVRD